MTNPIIPLVSHKIRTVLDDNACSQAGDTLTVIFKSDFDKVVTGIVEAIGLDQTPKTHIERMTDEYHALASKVQALKLFSATNKFYELERIERDLLSQQSRAMHSYLSVLKMRLDHYGVYL